MSRSTIKYTISYKTVMTVPAARSAPLDVEDNAPIPSLRDRIRSLGVSKSVASKRDIREPPPNMVAKVAYGSSSVPENVYLMKSESDDSGVDECFEVSYLLT